MSKKLYVGNLPYQVDESALEEAISSHGSVKSVQIITDFDTNRSKGFGFVEMQSDDEAQVCIENLDGKEFIGRTLRVNVARERTERTDRAPRQERW